jgi:ribosomal protein S18 acetylase RimI-like enzyme
MPLLVRLATPADAAALAELAAATFPLAAPSDTPREDLDAFIATNLSAARFAGYLADPGRILFVASTDGPLAGYTMLVAGEPADADAARAVRARPTIELSKIYVRPEQHGAGIAGALIEASLRAARERGARSMWLGVNQRNERANRFYEKQGFEIVGVKRFLVGSLLHDDFVRERPITDADESDAR